MSTVSVARLTLVGWNGSLTLWVSGTRSQGMVMPSRAEANDAGGAGAAATVPARSVGVGSMRPASVRVAWLGDEGAAAAGGAVSARSGARRLMRRRMKTTQEVTSQIQKRTASMLMVRPVGRFRSTMRGRGSVAAMFRGGSQIGHGSRWVAITAALAVLAALSITAGPSGAVQAATSGAGSPPSPTPGRAGAPGSIASIGDSISTATGTENLGSEADGRSWVTGEPSNIDSMQNRLGIANANTQNLASNGRRMQDFDNQVAAMSASMEYAVLLLGGNDVCRDSVAQMTSVSAYRNQFRAGLQALRAKNPDTLLFVASIPDVYNLWYIRGANSSINPHVADQTGQAGQARFYWDNPIFDIIPCSSLLENPTSTSSGDEARRQQVRQRVKDFNDVLEQECDADLRCRFDDDLLFNLTSNRVNPPDGAYKPRHQWFFEDNDISHNDGFWAFLCPAPGIISGGTICGDHFHPSRQGQKKLAQGGHDGSFDFTDASIPAAALAADRPPDGDGVYAAAVTVTPTGGDNVGLRGRRSASTTRTGQSTRGPHMQGWRHRCP